MYVFTYVYIYVYVRYICIAKGSNCTLYCRYTRKERKRFTRVWWSSGCLLASSSPMFCAGCLSDPGRGSVDLLQLPDLLSGCVERHCVFFMYAWQLLVAGLGSELSLRKTRGRETSGLSLFLSLCLSRLPQHCQVCRLSLYDRLRCSVSASLCWVNFCGSKHRCVGASMYTTFEPLHEEIRVWLCKGFLF